MAVFLFPDNFYTQWRARRGVEATLHDDGTSPPERLLQAIWQHQRLQRARLRTLDGGVVRVLHPGFWNHEGGPDFRGAVVQFGDAPPVAGDIEVDIRAAGWHAHGHDRNPNFKNVVLHVVWDAVAGVGVHAGVHAVTRGLDVDRGRKLKLASQSTPKRELEHELQPPPLLAIRDKLDAPVGELSVWLSADSTEGLPEQLRGQCCAPLREIPAERLTELLRQAAQIRFRNKAAHLQSRARQVGWEQSLWEGLFRALGYKHNVWPMQCLAEQRDRWLAPRDSPLALQARLLGIGGLLPSELTCAQAGADGYLRRVWDHWWRERDAFSDCLLPRALWRFHGQRPANHPQRRLALAAHWLMSENLVANIERWCAAELADEKLAASLLEILQTGRDDFWSWHWTIRSPRLARPQPLLGLPRLTDLAVNAVLPWLWARAMEGKNETLRRVIERRYHAWPAAEDNAVLRLARERLLGGAGRGALRTAAEQQGLMQAVRDFCDHSNAVCTQCQFPELVKEWNLGG